MGLLSWVRSLFSSPPPAHAEPKPTQENPTALTSPQKPSAPIFPEGWGALSAVGESQYQPALRRAARSGRVCWATLVPEPENPFDNIAVCVQVQGETVAYLSRTDARGYQRRLLTLSAPMQVPAKLIGGTPDKPTFGIIVDCREVEQLQKPKPGARRKPQWTQPTNHFNADTARPNAQKTHCAVSPKQFFVTD